MEAGASLSAVDNEVIKPSVKLIQSNIKLFKKQFLIKSSQTTQLYTTKVFYKQFSCHHHIKKSFFEGNTEVTKVLVEAGASLSAVDNEVIKPSVKLIQSNIKLFKWHMRNVI
jgi:hypothetical protein